MALTLTTNPVGSASVKLFAGFRPVEFVFKREDLEITSVTSGTGGAKINHVGDLSSYLSAGDSIYLYSEGTNYTYDLVTEVLSIAAGEITVTAPYIETGTGGYINYLKNYYVEMQCVNRSFSDVNILGFNLRSDGDVAGNITIDVSVANDLNRNRGALAEGHILESSTEFEVQYREVHLGSSNSFTLIDNKLIVLIYATEDPEEDEILNNFDLPKIYYGYPLAFSSANAEDSAGSTVKIVYQELNNNQVELNNDELTALNSDVNGFLLWLWDEDTTLEDATKFINFELQIEATFDFLDGDFDYPDFYTQ